MFTRVKGMRTVSYLVIAFAGAWGCDCCRAAICCPHDVGIGPGMCAEIGSYMYVGITLIRDRFFSIAIQERYCWGV